MHSLISILGTLDVRSAISAIVLGQTFCSTHPDMTSWETKFRCDIMTPLGSPVVPLEYIMTQSASGSTRATGPTSDTGVLFSDENEMAPSRFPKTTKPCCAMQKQKFNELNGTLLDASIDQECKLPQSFFLNQH